MAQTEPGVWLCCTRHVRHGITDRDFGPVHNRRLRTWRRTHLMGAITDKAALAGITVERVDERGTSSTCP